MTEAQARAFMAQVEKEVPEVLAQLTRGRQAEDGTGFIVKLQYDGRILTAYKMDDWLPIKWAWGLEDVKEEAPADLYLIEGIPMALEHRGLYWYGRHQVNGKTKRKYLGRVDPRPLYPLIEKREVTI